jgi:DNA-binding response OmpR family regulator
MSSLPKIFIVEDENELIEIYRAIFKKEEFEVEEARFGEEAKKEIDKWISGEKAKPDVVLLDLILPDMNGVVLLKKMRENEKTKDIPVFVLTNYSSKEIERIVEQYGVKDYIVKTDILPSNLLQKVKEVLKKDEDS